MKNIFIKILDFYLYSGFHIALAAICFILQLYHIFGLSADYHYLIFIFSSTSFLYLLHNLLGLNTLLPQCVREKIMRIAKMRVLLIVFLLIMGLISINSFLTLDWYEKFYLTVLAVISLWYVVPVTGKRLRDYPVIKIFLVALVWAAISCVAVFPEIDISIGDKILIFSERFLIIFSITIPFDIRDMDYDKAQGLNTLPLILGKTNAVRLAIVTVFAAISIAAYLGFKGIYDNESALALIAGYLLVIVMIYFSRNKQSDYYFTGILDGTAIIIYILLYIIK